MSFVKAFTKIADLDTHRDGTEFNRAGSDPVTYGGGEARANPSANPSFDPSGGNKKKKKSEEKQVAVDVALGTYKEAARRDDIAQGVSESLEKEQNSRTPQENLEDREAERTQYARYKRLKGKKND